MSEYGDFASPEDTAALIAKQWREALGEQPRVTCGCGYAAPIRFLFRCLYCGMFFCTPCGEVHFGKTRAQYSEEKENSDASTCQ